MRHTITSLVFLFVLTLASNAQVDYLEFRDRYSLSCGIPDSTELMRNQLLIDSLDHSKITNGKKQYLYDHGWVYYMRFLKWKAREDLEKAAESFEKGWNEHSDMRALWNLGTIYRALGDCRKALDMTEMYIEVLPDSIPVDYQQVYYRYKHCRDQ